MVFWSPRAFCYGMVMGAASGSLIGWDRQGPNDVIGAIVTTTRGPVVLGV